MLNSLMILSNDACTVSNAVMTKCGVSYKHNGYKKEEEYKNKIVLFWFFVCCCFEILSDKTPAKIF